MFSFIPKDAPRSMSNTRASIMIIGVVDSRPTSASFDAVNEGAMFQYEDDRSNVFK